MQEYLQYAEAEVIELVGTPLGELNQRKQIINFDYYEPFLNNTHVYNALLDIDPLLVWKAKNVPFYNFILHNKAYWQVITGTYAPPVYAAKTATKGFEPVHSGWQKKEGIYADTSITLQSSEQAITSYQEVLAAIHDRGKTAVLVLAPVHLEGQAVFQNLEYIRSVYRKLAGKNSYFLDFTVRSICADKRLFYNFTHLNAEGADYFSKDFAKALLKLNILSSNPGTK